MDVQMPNDRPVNWLWSWLPAATPARVRGVLAGALLVSGFTVVAKPPQATPAKRAAYLLAPQKLEPGDVPAIARGAIDDLPGTSLGSTPVTRSSKKPSTDGPAWLSGADPNVLPASGFLPLKSSSGIRTADATSTVSTSSASPAFPGPGDKSKTPAIPGPAMIGTDTLQDRGAPLRGTAANGAPVMAGPPAYLWYGYGAVIPGANAFAPQGQYPKASANWYSVTGATPGAFAVPVVNPYRATPGSESPTYNAGMQSRPPMTGPIQMMGSESPRVNPVPQGRPNPTISQKAAVPTPSSNLPPITTIGTGSMPSSLPPLPTPVGVPAMPAMPTPPPAAPMVAVPPAPAAPTLPAAPVIAAPVLPEPIVLPPAIPMIPAAPVLPEPSAVKPPAIPAAPIVTSPEEKKPIVGLPVEAAKPAVTPTPAAPSALPPSLTEESKWQPNNVPLPVPPGTWTPAATPALPAPNLFLEPGATNVKPTTVARGQVPDSTRPDPMATLIQGVCRGRADGIDVRWTGSKKLTVCFEVRTQAEANRLVKDISARPELMPVAIDFCVLVK